MRGKLFILLVAFIVGVYSFSNIALAAEQGYGLEIKTIQMQDNFINYYLIYKENNVDRKKESLIIYLTGSDLTCALGPKLSNRDFFADIVDKIDGYSSSEFAMLIPDKMNIGVGQDCGNDMKAISHYTLEERVGAAAAVIDSFLSDNDYGSVFLVGASEGASILPRVYNSLQHKKKISKLVMIAGGGLSQYEEFKILQKSKLPISADDRAELNKVDEVMVGIKAAPNAVDKTYYGWTYRRWSGFMSYRPVDDLVKIDIPILVMHGAMDINAPVESSRMIREEFSKRGKTNLTYLEYENYDHFFGKDFGVILKDMAKWLKEAAEK